MSCLPLPAFLRMEWFPARVSLACLTVLGLVNVFMVRVNLSVAIVAMVRQNRTVSNAHSSIQTYCRQHQANQSVDEAMVNTIVNETAGNAVTNATQVLHADPKKWIMEDDEEETLNWDEWMQGQVLGSFFYGYWISQVGGGRMAEVYGTKLVLGITVLSGGVSAFLTPIAAKTHYLALVILRALQGFMQGAALPCIFPMMVRWIPPFEQAKFVAYVLFCNNISITFTMALCGFVIEALGWEGAFYVTGGASFVWCLVWYICMYENPEEHPRISREELNYIVESKKSSDDKREVCPTVSSSASVPWLSLARSLPLWAIIVCEAGNSFGFSLYFSYLPTYIENIIGVPISQNGLLSALPFLSRYLGGVFFATSGECLLARGMVTVLGVRRFFSAIAMFGPAATLLAVAYAGCDPILAFFLLCFGFFLNGSITIGLFANKADLSLNFAGTVSGLGNTSANVISFVVPLVVGAITNNQQTIEAWQQVFWTCVPVYVACEVFYLVFASGSRQHWDLAKMRDTEEETQEKKMEDTDTD